ncbi:MAG: OB-fold domain-containing protein [Deltaproteobacteria bacterium]|nr:OB-fold domain-containing protein [Deltaproteobacteria bacterium]
MEQRPFNDISFRLFINEEKLMGSRCGGCGALFVPPRSICVHCSGAEMEWVQMKGLAKLAAFTCIAIGPPHMLKEGYDRKRPYCTGVVQLEEGPKVVARIEGIDTNKPENILIGTPLAAGFLRRKHGEAETAFLAFAPL